MAKRWQNNAGILRGVPDVLLAAYLDGPFTFWREQCDSVRGSRLCFRIQRLSSGVDEKGALPGRKNRAGP
jgi:hypothetical protein